MPEEVNNATKQATQAQVPEVNDIAPPPAPTPTTEPNVAEVTKEAPAVATSESLPAVKKAPEATFDPVAVSEPQSAMQPASSTSDHTNSQAESTKPNTEDEQPIVPMQAHSSLTRHDHRNNRKFAALLVVIIATILAAGTVFIYVTAQDNTQEATPTSNTNEQVDPDVEQPAQPATTESVDQSIQDVDQTLESLDSDADFGDGQLTDDSLGL